ncbi:MAG: hypothetical protein JXA57_17070 [Armatimonadetes bacterium]|nr:hypothetical protein [Armatimonadota bacterium]
MSERRGLRKAGLVSGILGIAAIAAIVLAFLALSDIGRGEPDLSLEWNVVRVAFLVVAAFIVSAIVLLVRIFRAVR